jgi:DNA gyrase subunit A
VIALPEASEGGEPQPPYGLAVTRGGLSFRFPLVTHRDPSNKTGRRYARLNEGDEVVLVAAVGDRDGVVVAASDGVALGVKASEVPVLSAAGKGSALLRLSEGERVVGAQIVVQKKDVVQIETEKGKTLEVTWAQIDGDRGSAGQSLGKRDRFSKIVTPPPVTPSLNPN